MKLHHYTRCIVLFCSLGGLTTNKTDSQEIKADIKELARKMRTASMESIVNLGTYVGTNYYTGKLYEKADSAADPKTDVVVTSKVRQIIDYVDNDATFVEEDNLEKDHY